MSLCGWLGKAFDKMVEPKIYIHKTPMYGQMGDHVTALQTALVSKGYAIKVDGHYGPQTKAAVIAFQKSFGSTGSGIIGQVTLQKLGLVVGEKPSEPDEPSGKRSPPWYLFALQFKGKNESDSSFNKEMSAKWPLVGLKLGTIAQSWAAWCGLAMAVALAGVGVDYQRNGALAKNWASYGVAIDWKKDGIPQGAIVQLNATSCSSSSGNHVSQAEGDCTPEHLAKSGATIDLYGGNQGNSWKVSTYKVSKLCAVRWPKDVKDYPKPGRITKDLKCTSGSDSGESTR